MADLAAPAEPDAVGDPDFLGDFSLDFEGVVGLDLFPDFPSVVDPSPAPPGGSGAPVPSRTMDEVERFLMTEEDGGVGDDELALADDFFADVLFAGSDEGSVRSAVSNGDAATPEEDVAEGDGDGKEAAAAESEKEMNGNDSEGKSGEDEDLLIKKRRRQMRNRDSAMKSRERKKMYVRDLEMKSKFLEAECRRLQHALHCCTVENMALRQCLQKGKALGAPLAKQESAVLFVESLLLGSLFWLMSIVCLFLMPVRPVEAIVNVSEEATSRTQVIQTKGLESKRLSPGLGSGFIFKKRKCKAMGTKMKITLFPLDMVFG